MVEDENDEIEDPELEMSDEEDDEEDARRRRRRKKPKQVFFSKGEYCACNKRRGRGDEPEFDVEEDQMDVEIDTMAGNVEDALADPRRKKRGRKWSKKQWAAALRALVARFFRSRTLKCYCTRNRNVVR